MKALTDRALPVGAEPVDRGVDFRVWAPKRKRVEVVLEHGPGAGTSVALEPEAGGYFSGLVDAAEPGTRYRYRLDSAVLAPDPAARFQPDGPHAASEVIDAAAFSWTDRDWSGPDLSRSVIYELHVGTFSPQGTWRAAEDRLEQLADLGVSVVELMPVGEFPGRFGWGYDGVCWFAPTRLYGRPDDFRGFVDRAHALGIGVILDVVYNHFGPVGCYLREFSDTYFSTVHRTEWGAAINFDGPGYAGARELVASNAEYWIREFHLDGLRLDATQSIFDASNPSIVAEIAQCVRAAAGTRRTLVIAENEPQDTDLVRSADAGGQELDALWNDDFHHTVRVAATGHNEAYYSDYHGTPQELISAVRWGYLYQGQYYTWQNQRRGRPALDLQPHHFIHYIENHDQVANSGRGDRLHRLTAPGQLRALTALLLLGPATPMLFQGQEFAASTPFLYFADQEPGVAAKVRAGRKEFLAQFPSLATEAAQRMLARPDDPSTFEQCKLDWSEAQRNGAIWALHRDLIALSRADPTLREREREHWHGAVLNAHAFVLRVLGNDGDDRLLIVNLGAQLQYQPAPEPLLAPPWDRVWQLVWSSEDVKYGGLGTPPPETRTGWEIPAQATVLMAAAPLAKAG